MIHNDGKGMELGLYTFFYLNRISSTNREREEGLDVGYPTTSDPLLPVEPHLLKHPQISQLESKCPNTGAYGRNFISRP